MAPSSFAQRLAHVCGVFIGNSRFDLRAMSLWDIGALSWKHPTYSYPSASVNCSDVGSTSVPSVDWLASHPWPSANARKCAQDAINYRQNERLSACRSRDWVENGSFAR